MQPVPDPIVPDFVKQYQRVDSYAEIDEIMRHPDFAQGGAPERRIFFEDTLLFLEGDAHREQKRIFADIFSRDALAYYEHRVLQPVIDQTLSELAANRGGDGLVRGDLVELVQIMLNRISAGVTGADGVDTPERTARFRELVVRLGEATAGQFSTRNKEAVIQDGRAALQHLVDEFLQASLDRRQALVRRLRDGEIGKDALPRDMLTALCLHEDVTRPEDAVRIPYVWRQCALFMTAAIQTTTHMLPHVILHLDEWFKEHPEDRRRAADPAFVRLAVGESLRLHQTSPVKFRIALKDITLSTGRTVGTGEMVALFAPAANLEPEIFGPDARTFNPYRKPADSKQPWGLTFGAGRHMCLGRNLVTGVRNQTDEKYSRDGSMIKVVQTLYAHGMELDPAAPPRRTSISYHDAYESVPIILRTL